MVSFAISGPYVIDAQLSSSTKSLVHRPPVHLARGPTSPSNLEGCRRRCRHREAALGFACPLQEREGQLARRCPHLTVRSSQ